MNNNAAKWAGSECEHVIFANSHVTQVKIDQCGHPVTSFGGMLIPAAQLKNVLSVIVGSLERFYYSAMILHFTGIFIIYIFLCFCFDMLIQLRKRVLMNLLWSPWVWGPGWQCMAGTSPHPWRWGQASWRKGRPRNCGCLRQSPAAAPHPSSSEYSWRFWRRNRSRNVTIVNYYIVILLISDYKL